MLKLALELDAYSLVLIESTGKRTKSIEVPANPPARIDVKQVLNVKVLLTTYGLSSAILNFLII